MRWSVIKKIILGLFLSLMVLNVSGQSVEADIQPSDPEKIVLDQSNNYEVFKQFDGTSSTGDIDDYVWNFVDDSQETEGPVANFTFSRQTYSTNEIELTVIGSQSDYNTVTQRVEDVPELSAKITGGANNQNEVKSGEQIDFKVEDYNNSFNDPVEFSWSVDGDSGTGKTFSHTFDSSDQGKTIDVKVTAEDQAGQKGTDTISVDVMKDPEYQVSIQDTNSPIEEEDTLEVDAEVDNVGDYGKNNRKVVLEIDGTEEDSVSGINLSDGGETTETLEWNTGSGDKGTYTAKVKETDGGDSDSKDIEVNSKKKDGKNGEPKSGDGESFDEFYSALDDIKDGDSKDIEFSSSPVTDVDIEFSDSVDEGELASKATDVLPDDADEEPSDEPFKYIELKKTNFTNDDIDSVSFDFEVEKDWVEENNIMEDSIKLQRYDDSWEKLSTSKEDEDEDNIYFSAESPDGLSVFSITGVKAESDIQVTDVSFSSSDIEPNDTVNIDVVVENKGNVKGSYTVSFDLAGDTLEEKVENLSAGNQITLSFQKQFTEEGNYKVDLGGESASITVGNPGFAEATDQDQGSSNQTQNNQTSDDQSSEDQGGFPFVLVSLLVVFIGSLVAIGAYLVTHDEMREELVEKVEGFKEGLGDGEEENEDEFEWDGFDR